MVPSLIGIGLLVRPLSAEEAEVKIVNPFPESFIREQVDFYVCITNTGSKDLVVDVGPGTHQDVVLEVDPALSRSPHPPTYLRRVEDVRKKVPSRHALLLRPGETYAQNRVDLRDDALDDWEACVRVRAHFLIDTGRWATSDWVERNILPAPDLHVKAIHEYPLDEGEGQPRRAVIPLKVRDETWLFFRLTGRNLVRLCRCPGGTLPSSFEDDVDGERLTIRFDGESEPVVIDTNTAIPVSGSERTVPQLHLWKKLAGRPFTDNHRLQMENAVGHTGPMPATDMTRRTVPVAVPATPAGTGVQPEAGSGKGASSSPRGSGYLWALVAAGGVVVALCAWVGWRAKVHG